MSSKTVKKMPRATKPLVIPSPGRKMGKQEARDYVFKKYAEALAALAKH